MMLKNLKKKIAVLCTLASIFVACSDEKTVTEVVQESYATMDIYESSRDLPECGLANKNQQVLVKEDSSLRVCSENTWQKVSVTEYNTNVSCYTVPVRGNRGYKIMCNGDSVGVIQNGSAGTRGENGTGCSIRYENDSERSVIVCGTDSVFVDYPLADTTKYKETPVDTSIDVPVDTIPVDTVETPNDTIPADTVEIPVDTIPVDTADIPVDTAGIDSVEVENDSAMAVSMDSLGGYSQKGPFVKGSMVYMYELQDGRTLKQTNGNFVSRIDSDDGHFKFVARNLVSQYVLMQATGYYLNEVTNQRTTEMITLNGIVDVSKRSTANINVLTHLEYPRVNYLVTVEKKRFKDAKRQARAEILDAFGWDTTGVGNFEDMVVADYDGNFLYTLSFLLQADLTVAQVTERLNKIAMDLEKDGKWDDAKLRIEMADWIIEHEPHIMRAFWQNEYGLPYSCEKEGELFVAKSDNGGKYDGKTFKCSLNGIRQALDSDVLVGKGCLYSTRGDTAIYVGKYWTRTFECTDNSNDGLNWHLTGSYPTKLMETMTDSRDNRTYAITTIGNQTWMAENLNYADSVSYPSMLKRNACAQSDVSTLYFNNYYDSTDCHIYGRAYTWAAAMDSLSTGCGYHGNSYSRPCTVSYPVQGICPDGWHIPDTTEIRELLDFVKEDVGVDSYMNALKGEIPWYDSFGVPAGTDKYGFNVLPEGSRYWSSSMNDEGSVFCLYFDWNLNEFKIGGWCDIGDNPNGVRCIKNREESHE